MKFFTGAIAAAAVTVLGLTTRASAENWPQWRGPFFNGSTTETNLPGEGISSNDVVWAASLPGPSAATPAVWGDRVFLSSGDKAAREVVAMGVDARNGQVLWHRSLCSNRGTPGNNDMASPSPVTDGEHAWFLTGSGTLAAFTKEGEPMWRRDLTKDYGAFNIFFGYSSSPLLFEGRLYVLAMRNENPAPDDTDQNHQGPLDSFLLALDPATGRTLWRMARPTDATNQSRESYVTPYPMVWHGRKEIVLAGGECVTGHAPDTGDELWRWWYTPPDRQKLQHVVPSPVADDGLIYVVRPEHRPLFALRAGGTGLVGDEGQVWTFATNQCWITTPLPYRGRLYVLQEEQHTLVCLEEKTGRMVWTHKLPARGQLEASPTGADGKIYLLSLNGEVVVLAAGDEYRELGTLRFDESPCRSTIVAANGKLFVRAGSHLYCLGAHPPDGRGQ